MEPRSEAPRALVVAAFVAVSVIWGSTYLGIRMALVDFPPFAIGALRFLLAGAALCGYARLRGQRWPSATEWKGAAIVGGLFFIVGNGLLNVAEQSVSSSLAAVLVATMPLWATVFARAFGEPVGRSDWLGLGLGLAGVVVMNLGGELRASGQGAALALFAPMGWALGSVLSKRLRLPSGPMIVGAEMLAGGVAVLVISVVLGEKWPASPSLRSVSAVAYLAGMGSLVGFTAFAFLLRHTRAAVATSYAYINPVVAILLGVGLAHEHLDVASACGGGIVLTAVLLVTRAKRSQRGGIGAAPLHSASSSEGSASGALVAGGTVVVPPVATEAESTSASSPADRARGTRVDSGGFRGSRSVSERSKKVKATPTSDSGSAWPPSRT
jgi:drug/metabolite transporter (DMT)-like permease